MTHLGAESGGEGGTLLGLGDGDGDEDEGGESLESIVDEHGMGAGLAAIQSNPNHEQPSVLPVFVAFGRSTRSRTEALKIHASFTTCLRACGLNGA